MNISGNSSLRHLSPAQNMEGSSVQVHAEYTNRYNNNNKTQKAFLKINIQALKVFTGNNNATDDTAMSGVDYPMGGIANNFNGLVNSESCSSINTGQIQQQADLARLLQPTIRTLQSATDKALNKIATGANGTLIGPNIPTEPRAMRRIYPVGSSKSSTSNLPKKQPSVPNTISKKPKKKKVSVTNPQANNPSGSSGKKPRQRKPKEGKKGNMAHHMERRKNDDSRKLADADKAARADADKKVNVLGNGLNPKHWETMSQQGYQAHTSALNANTMAKVAKAAADEKQKVLSGGSEPKEWQTTYEQEYQARTAKLRARQLRDDNALMFALNGLSVGAPKDEDDDEDLITF